MIKFLTIADIIQKLSILPMQMQTDVCYMDIEHDDDIVWIVTETAHNVNTEATFVLPVLDET